MRARLGGGLAPRRVLLAILCLNVSYSSSVLGDEHNALVSIKRSAVTPKISPSAEPQPFLPSLAPAPLMPFTNATVPKLSGLCSLNFSVAQSIMSITATDCWASFAPYLANVVCCPQFDATLVILMGQSSKNSGMLALNATHSNHCLSDVLTILEAQGANATLQSICSVSPANLTAASCPITDVNEFESSVDTSRLLTACQKIDPVKECCDQTCQNAILDAAQKLSLNGLSSSDGNPISPGHSNNVDDCKNIVLRWLASKLDPSSGNSVLRGLSNCNTNKVCPLKFPNITTISKECEGLISDQTDCCEAMESYVSHLQEQSFLTNLQALNCATYLGMKLQQANVSKNLYNLCHINLKDFSLQALSQESGCLLPSLPSDATFDQMSGVSFICDLNDNIAAPWPSSTSLIPLPSCNKTGKIPALPKTSSAHRGACIENLLVTLLLATLLFLKMPP